MKVTRLALATACAVGAALALPQPARAQSTGYQLNRFEPTTAGDPFFFVEHPWYSSVRWFAGGLTLDYANNLLAASHRDANGNTVIDPSPIANGLGLHVDLAGSLWDRVALSFSLPIVLYENGTPFSGVGPSSGVVGDPRVGVRVRLWGQPEHDPFSLSLSAYLWIPVGAAAQLAGDHGVRVLPRLVLGGIVANRLRWSFNAGYYYRNTARLSSRVDAAGNTVGSEVQLAAGLAVLLDHQRLSVGPEANLWLAVAGNLPASQSVATLEVLAGLKYLVANAVQLGVGVGAGVAGEPGPPDARVLFSVAYAPRRPANVDSDGDGIPDASDACRKIKGGPSSDPALNGCPHAVERVVLVPDPDGHVGAIAVDDGKGTVTVINKAYQSAETGKTGGTQVVQRTPADVQRQAGALAQALPTTDRDGDGILDKNDACPDRAGLPSQDPARNGCPKPVERVTVLPDENGHVGGVEVRDPTGKILTVLDKAYATSEVGLDGKANALPPRPENAPAVVAQLKQALPPADSDDDGIPDAQDACPNRKGEPSEDPEHNGCPKAVERVTVIPDEDGHIGAVEVTDDMSGKKTLLDKAYATSEVGADGDSRAIEAPPQEVAKKFAAAMAARPPGARMIIYFTEKAEPARDLTGPIAAVVEETKRRQKYSIEVVGHTDELGRESTNVRLGYKRAQLIADRLIEAGVPKSSIKVLSKGSSQPLIKGSSTSAEVRNRRVEVFVR